MGVGKRELTWTQTQKYKLYRDGSFYAVADRYEKTLIAPGTGSAEAEETRAQLQAALDSMPTKAARLVPGKSKEKSKKKK